MNKIEQINDLFTKIEETLKKTLFTTEIGNAIVETVFCDLNLKLNLEDYNSISTMEKYFNHMGNVLKEMSTENEAINITVIMSLEEIESIINSKESKLKPLFDGMAKAYKSEE